MRENVNTDEAWAARGRRSVSEVAQELIEEGIRMRECPGIYFASEPTGRTAKVAGAGLGVWEVLRDYVHDQDIERLREGYWPEMRAALEAGLVVGGQVHDARIAALCRLHAVRALWTADRDFDFGRFPGLKVLNPPVG